MIAIDVSSYQPTDLTDLSVFADPQPDPAEGYRTALYHLRDVVLAPLRSTPCPTTRRLAAMREADRIFKQFLG